MTKRLFPILLYFFIFLSPLSGTGASIILGIIILYTLYELVFTKKIKIDLNLTVVACSSYVVLILLSFIFTPDKPHWFEVEKRISLLLIPLFLSGYKTTQTQSHIMISAFVSGVLIMDCIVSTSILNHYFHTNSLEFLNGSVSKVLIFPRPYIGLYNTIAIGLLFCLLVEKSYIFKYKVIVLTSLCLFFFLLITLIGARLAFGISLILFLILLCYYLVQGKKWGYILIVIVLLFLIPTKNIINRFNNFSTTEPRIFIWKSCYNIIESSEHWNNLYGTFSNCKTQRLLNLEYKEETQLGLKSIKKRDEALALIKKNGLITTLNTEVKVEEYPDNFGRWFWIYATKQQFNTHNQYLSLFLSYGLLGILVICCFFIGLLKQFYNTKSIYPLLTIVILGFIFMVENILATQSGIFAILVLLILSNTIFTKDIPNSV